MKVKLRQSGLSLTEMMVVIATIALLTVFGIPAIRTFVKSFETEAGVRGMINAALSNARAIAAKEQRYAGVRFQQKWQADNKGCQYMIFIIHDKASTGYASGFRAVSGAKPLKLPDNIGVMDLTVVEEGALTDADKDNNIDGSVERSNATTFSVIFSPSGKLIIHELWVRNKDGSTTNSSEDDIFNTRDNVMDPGHPSYKMFVQDENVEEGDVDYYGFNIEPSRREFIIYDRGVFDRVNIDRRWTDYLEDLKDTEIYINPYTGRMID